MPANNAFVKVEERGWQRGLSNLLDAEFGQWWKTRQWWVMALIWTAVINFILAGVLWSAGVEDAEAPAILYTIFTGVFAAVAVVIMMQSSLVGEKESGTAEWILSKPVSRSAFILSKLAANMVGTAVTMVLIPGTVAYIQMSLANGAALPVGNFLAAMAVLALSLWFFLALTLMLGAYFNNRAPVIGIPLALLFGQQWLLNLSPLASKLLPWAISVPVEGVTNGIAPALILGNPVSDSTPVLVAAVCVVLFSILGITRFQKEEF